MAIVMLLMILGATISIGILAKLTFDEAKHDKSGKIAVVLLFIGMLSLFVTATWNVIGSNT